MPPRRSARVAAGAAATAAPLAPLPQSLVRAVFARVPVDTRLRCREVSHGWCDTLSDAAFWTELDLSDGSGVVARVTPKLLRAAARLAGAPSFIVLLRSARAAPNTQRAATTQAAAWCRWTCRARSCRSRRAPTTAARPR
jgi:hypothetical protein